MFHEWVIDDPSRTLFAGSGTDFIAFQESIIRDPDHTNEEIFDAKISLAVYYTAIENYSAADAVLATIDRDTLSVDETNRLNNVERNLNEARNAEN